MKLNTTRFGEIEIEERDIIDFNKGILGFESFSRYILFPVNHDQHNIFYFLQSIEEASLCFLLVNPFSLNNQYELKLEDTLIEKLEISSPEEVLVYTLVSVQDSIKTATTNLKAPLVINLNNNKGKQIVLEGKDYPIKQSLQISHKNSDGVKKG